MIKTPMVSVIMSVYNDEENVANSIKSILNQTYSNYEFIIMDDGSIDETWKILKTFQTNSNKIKLLKNKKNIGLTRSLNKLLAETQGDYIARQDSDDLSLRGRIESQISFIKEFLVFLKERKKFILWPIITVLALCGILIVLSEGSVVAPFIYSIF